MSTIEANRTRYFAACHAMQTGVQLDHTRNGGGDGTPKHLRVGVNIALRDHGSLVKLFVQKGLITDEEYFHAIADGMEEEVRHYHEKLGLGPNVTLG